MVETRASKRSALSATKSAHGGTTTEVVHESIEPASPAKPAKPKPSSFNGSGRVAGGKPKPSLSPRKPSSKPSLTSPKQPGTSAATGRSSRPGRKPLPRYQPKEPIRNVTAKDEAPGRNIYGEPQMGSDCDQRLQQAIIFLSDEGPENYPRFKDMLKKLEFEIGTVWPSKKRHGDAAFQYSDQLHRKVMAMIKAQRARLDSGARKWFEQTMFPQYPADDSDGSIDYPPKPVPPKIFTAKDTATASGKPGNGENGTEKSGPVLSTEEVKRLREDPWYEEMPRPEVWHRNMPDRFPFGDTPYMEIEMSKQISKDLGEGIAD